MRLTWFHTVCVQRGGSRGPVSNSALPFISHIRQLRWECEMVWQFEYAILEALSLEDVTFNDL